MSSHYKSGNNRGGAQICRQFQSAGKCRFGSRCKFSHEPGSFSKSRSSRASRPVKEFGPRSFVPIDECDVDLSSELANQLSRAVQDKSHLDQVWTTTLRLLGRRDDEINQRMAQTLVEEDKSNGLKAIEATVQDLYQENPDRIQVAENFLLTLSHPGLLDSLALAKSVDKIYARFAGQNGDDAIAFITRYCQALAGNYSLDGSLQPMRILTMIVKVISAMFTRVPRAKQRSGVAGLFKSAEDLVAVLLKQAAISTTDHDSFMARLSSMKGAAAKGKIDTGNNNTDRKDVDVPGGRHDNDFDCISDIKIFPTYDEIVSDKPEYLPSTDLTTPNFLEDPLQRYLDTTFRLMRHDIFGSMKTVLRGLITQVSKGSTPTLSENDARANLYHKAGIRNIFVNDRNELEAVVSFQGLPHVAAKSFADQSKWWSGSSRLEEGSLICFLSRRNGKNNFLLLQVTVKNPSSIDLESQKHKFLSTLVTKTRIPSITVKLATSSPKDLDLLCELYRQGAQGYLVDFHNMIPATFYPVLSNLQRVQRAGEMALSQWVLPGLHGDLDNIPPPAYSLTPEFVYDLTGIARHDMVLDTKKVDQFSLTEFEAKSGLDHGQSRGLVDALTREYCLIQGPPGTGKSFVGQQIVRTLTAPQAVVEMGPILIVCYTNHALDQFLKTLLDRGFEDIVRVGSRSQAPELEEKNIVILNRTTAKTRTEMRSLSDSSKYLEEAMEKVSVSLSKLDDNSKQPTWAALDKFLLNHHPLIHSQLKPASPHRFQNARNQDPLVNWLGRKPTSPGPINGTGKGLKELIRKAEWDIRSISAGERWELVESWLGGEDEHDNSALHDALKEADYHREAISNVREEVRRRTLMKSRIIGMTTTSLAKNIDTLRKVGIRVVICEEAAEVMEAHMISALMPGVEHFIQIGDHKQLRPQINDYNLSLESSSRKKWQFDRSQFERRAMGEPGLKPVPVSQLSVQRRMRPEISRLIKRVYPSLEDHESVQALPNVAGMHNSLFWLDHRHFEDGQYATGRVRSHSNKWEVSMAAALVRHLVRQGAYDSSDIALLTPYTGQLQQLRTALSNEFEVRLNEQDQKKMDDEGWIYGLEEPKPAPERLTKKQLLQTLRVATVDNFQGEEAKVIIVSLVRSNRSRQVGFLATENRINVLLSRAQHGMYLIGNAETYQNVPMWAEVHQQLSDAGNVGDSLEICCPRHPETPIVCSEPEHFKAKSPEGGCNAACNKPLECGHMCKSKCHSDMMHQTVACGEPCNRKRDDCDHPCPKTCAENCGPCTSNIGDLKLFCGHFKKNSMCKERDELIYIVCATKVKKVIPFCGHYTLTECRGRPKELSCEVKCMDTCGKKLKCGHACTGICSECTYHDGWAPEFRHQPCKSCV